MTTDGDSCGIACGCYFFVNSYVIKWSVKMKIRENPDTADCDIVITSAGTDSTLSMFGYGVKVNAHLWMFRCFVMHKLFKSVDLSVKFV
jgi:hypothetical protein